ncbi:MAG: DinB family protein [Acidobacteria bacterium]|nr:DinB family protein [Acidobacteriota bacterium]
MHLELEDLAKQTETLIAEWRALFDRHPEADLAKGPADGGWSAIDNLAHLSQTVRLYLPKIDAALAACASVRSDGPYQYNLLGRFFVWVLEPPVRMKVKAPPLFHPAAGLTPAGAMEEFAGLHRELVRRMERADGLDLGKVKVASPASDKMKISLGSAFASMNAHGRRHLWQARNTLGATPPR